MVVITRLSEETALGILPTRSGGKEGVPAARNLQEGGEKKKGGVHRFTGGPHGAKKKKGVTRFSEKKKNNPLAPFGGGKARENRGREVGGQMSTR